MKKVKILAGISTLFIAGFVFVLVLTHVDNGREDVHLSELIEHGRKPDGFAQYYHDITVPIGEVKSGYNSGYWLDELKKARNRQKVSYKKSFSDTLIWIERGPVNVGGRTRSVLIDPDDPTGNTWYAGTASGGIWKTDDAGETWMDLTPDLPNLSTAALAMAPSNHNVIYAGTGEGFGNIGSVTGDGIYVTKDKGENWSRLDSTIENADFWYINKLWVDPTDENEVIAVTNTGVFKTFNGGETWEETYSASGAVQDIRQNPENPNTLYASVNSLGVIKSLDRGMTWILTGNEMLKARRISIDISPVDTSILFASVENSESTLDVYISRDAGDSWVKHLPDSDFINFHNAQGWYNNTIKAHPLDENKVYVAGVYIGLLTFEDTIEEADPQVLAVDTVDTSSFLDFINFGAEYLGGGMETGLVEGAYVDSSDFVSVELRFGPGKTQKAHRFLVPEGEGPGVPRTDYEYQDYVDVPFEAWDVTNNRQLMVSFRDQERDGKFNLIHRDPDNVVPGREYIFIHAMDYNADAPNASIVNADSAFMGGHYSKMLYFFWPTLSADATWDPNNLPESKISIEYGSYQASPIKTEIIHSSSKNTNLHVDHHDLEIIMPINDPDSIRIILGNDGGVGYSMNSGESWEQMSHGFITTQFYGVAKKTGFDEFIGGLQDNGTYQSPTGKVASLRHDFIARVGGDGFQTLWHPDGNKMLASVYNNQIYYSSSSGFSWRQTENGLGEDDGPFITKLSSNRQDPDVVFTIGSNGVYRNTSFGAVGTDWKLTEIANGLSLSGSVSSSLNVKVSKANPNIVWAGSGMFGNPELNIFVSTDQGVSFNATSNYFSKGYISGMATHPTDDSTAYVMFSYYQSPKILRTTDLGKTWEDITGFVEDSASTRGFPDVAVHDLLVMPHDTNVLWAATVIGIVESLDNGESWHILESDFPNVSVYQLDYQDNQIILATHGRGIWTAGNFELPDEPEEPVDTTSTGNSISFKKELDSFTVYPNPTSEKLYVKANESFSANISIKLYSLAGQLIKDDQKPLNGPGDIIQLRVDDVLPGNYILEIRGKNISETHQVVIFH